MIRRLGNALPLVLTVWWLGAGCSDKKAMVPSGTEKAGLAHRVDAGGAAAPAPAPEAPERVPAPPASPPVVPAVVPGTPSGGEKPSAPGITLVYGSELGGYLEPCHCTDGMIGGLARRARFLQDLRARAVSPVVAVEGGNVIRDASLQSLIKLTAILDCLAMMGYQALAVGGRDVGVGPSSFVERFAGMSVAEPVPMVCANLRAGELEGMLREALTIDAGGLKVLVTGLVSPDLVAGVAGVEALDPVAAARRFADTPADIKILLASAVADTCRAWAGELPFFDVVIGGLDEEDPLPAETIGAATYVCPGRDGKYGAYLVLSPGEGGRWRAEPHKVRLARDVGETAEVRERLNAYQYEVAMYEDMLAPGKGPHPQGEYAGAEKCAECHAKAYEVYKASRHADALETLVERDLGANPECLICHVVGYGFDGGFRNTRETPHMGGVSCEACHGPGRVTPRRWTPS